MNQLIGRRAVLAVALLAPITLLATACTSGSHSASVARLSAATTTASSSSSSAAASDLATQALAFARCLRANGLPNWPDPLSNGTFDKSKLQATGYSTAQTRAVEDGPCKSILPTTAPSSPNSQTITTQQQQDYINAVACMRAHGFSNFPDPTFSGDHVTLTPPPGVDTNSTQFTQAQHICKQLIPAGLPYSGSDA
ncbi:MAG TPA: hypothetical protein VGD55_12705 [Acidothermaceae bacterium]